MRRGPSPAPSPGESAGSSLPMGGRSSSMRLASSPSKTQAKLLRVLQEHEFDRVGATSPRKVDVRVIAATNRNLLKAVSEKAFRDDLYYRLSVFPILLPPLRERSEDVPLLVRFLLDRFAARIGKSVDAVSQETMQRLTAYSWPGNVRELENILERAVILATGPTLEIGPDILSEPVSATAAGPRLALEDVERNHILNVLGRTSWVIDGAQGARPLSWVSTPTPCGAGSRSSASSMRPTAVRSVPRYLVISPPGCTEATVDRFVDPGFVSAIAGDACER